MGYEQFKKMTYHTQHSVRIPGSRTVIDKRECFDKKGKLDHAKIDELLKQIYDNENYKNR